MNQRGIIYILFAIVGIPVLIQIGSWSATDPVYAGISAVLVVGIIVLSQLGTRCWLLIPFFAAFGGALNALPGHFAPRDLAVGVVAVVMPILWVVRRFPIRFRFGSLELSLAILLLFLAQAYMRNPVGLSIFGSGSIGGRPYFELGVSTAAFLILSVLMVDLRDVRAMVVLMFSGRVATALYDTLVGVFPVLGAYGAAFYQSSGASSAIMQYLGLGADPSQGTGRMLYLKGFGAPLTTLALAYRSPLQLLDPRNFWFALLVAVAGVAILLSGFRSGVAEMGLMVVFASFLHRKPMQVVFMMMLGGPVLAVLLVLQGTMVELPLPAQRALSFLPADWNQRAVSEAQGSSDWRFLMWEEALTSDRYIRNKWLGDGFGFTAREMAYQAELTAKEGLSEADQQEYFLTVGDYHSGPIETIKRIGYLGLGCLFIVMCVFLKTAVNLVSRTRGSPYFPYAMFLAIPLVIHPFYFILVFGTLKGSMTVLLLGGGGMRLLQNSFGQWAERRERHSLEQALADGSATESQH